MMGVFNNLVMYDQNVPQSGLKSIVPDLATEWSWDEASTSLTFKLRQGVKWHDGKPFTAERRQMHLGSAAGQGNARSCAQPAQGLVPQPRRGRGQGRLRGDLPAEAAAARLHRAARLGLLAGLSLPCAAARDAAASDRHRPVQVRRVQAQRDHQGHAQPRLLEEGPALSRRHRLQDHQEPARPACWPSSPASRHDLALFPAGADAERHQEPGAAGDLPAGADQRPAQRA